MDILCIDIGGGTQDICCYTGESRFENSLKLVLPSPSKRIAAQIAKLDSDIFINGKIIGGGISHELSNKLKAGKSVFISQKAAPSIRDDIDQVKSMGFTVVEEVVNPNIVLDEFDYEPIMAIANFALSSFSPEIISLAVQDHGYIKGQSDRVTRLSFLKDFLKNGLKNAFFTDKSSIPSFLTRFHSIYDDAKQKAPSSKVAITDTAIIACLGASLDKRRKAPYITLDTGNCHTFAALLDEEDNLLAFFEHHTHTIMNEKIISYLKRLALGETFNDEILEEGGHGMVSYSSFSFDSLDVLVTGPRRQEVFTEELLMANPNIIFSNPKGDTMMTGPLGQLMQQGIKP